MKKFLSKVKFLGQGQQWWFAFLIAAATLVAPLASHASEFPGMGAAYAQRLEQYRKISSLWLAPQALLSKAQEPPVPPFNTYHLSLNTIPNWSARGAYCDWLHIDLPETFRFPVGLEYLTRITILAYGEVRCPRRGDATRAEAVRPTQPKAFLSRVTEAEDSSFSRGRNAASPLATLPQRVSIEPNVSTVSHGLTPSNTYLIAWQNACVERSETNRVNAAIELFPDGSVTTIWQPLNPNQQPTTNHQQPVPPPGFHGHGQDADWIRGNFALLQSFDPALTNAEEIISLGYDTWLATRAVGIDAENGHCQAIVTINQQLATNNQPPTYLVCGPYKVVVTQPGTYRFPLEVFKHYPTRTYPEALALTITYDDGFTDISHPPLNIHHSYLNTKSAPPPDNIYDVCMHPTLYLWPSTIALSVAASSIVTFKCNVPSSAWVYFSSMWQTTRIILRGSRLAEIEEAEVEDLVTIFVETADGTTSASFAIVDDRPRHYCDDTCVCPICEWCYSSTNRWSEASVTNGCPCCTCP